MTNPTSYFSKPASKLDPTLFEGRLLRSWVRQGVMSLLSGFLGQKYRNSEVWAQAWLAGSGVSYQWESNREPGDLDCLVGVEFTKFRQANPEYSGLSDKEIADQINEQFKEELQPQTESWNGYELTFYVNPRATDIRAIKPYAAYDLKHDEWTVSPDPNQEAPSNSDWDRVVDSDANFANQISTRFTAALNEVQVSHNDATRRNAENRLKQAGEQGNALYKQIHENRSLAFSPEGEGYADFNNYRWQAGKRSGAIQSLRAIRESMKSISAKSQNNYGVELPDASTLIRRAAVYRKN